MILKNLTITGKKLMELTDCDVLEHKTKDLGNEKVDQILLLASLDDCMIIHVFFDGIGFFGFQKNIALLYRSDWCNVDGSFEDKEFVSKESKKIYEELKYKLKTL